MLLVTMIFLLSTNYLLTAEIIYEIDTHSLENEHNNLENLLKIPFQKQRTAVALKKE